MAMEMRQELKLQQQLVMTPQLQQAIKLLQLSRMELVDLVREEMLENPILEDDREMNPEQGATHDSIGDDQAARQLESAGNTELPVAEVSKDAPTSEVKADSSAVNEIDWENYLESYSSSGPAAPAYRPDGDEMPSLEATLTRTASLSEHLMWQLKMS
ncbi:MAG: RNA polymerase sigma-54 factor, partial [Myxococcota bacterium]